LNRFIAGGLAAIALSLLAGTASAESLRIALHGQAGIDAFKPTAERIEKTLGVDVEIVEYPAPDKDYMTKLLTELAAGNGPDLFSIWHP
jgi:multiple sugar transport system substrate-binding protein